MRAFWKWSMVLGVAALMVSPALAQRQRGQGGGFGQGGVARLIANTGVQEELKLTDEQKQKVTDVTTKIREKFRDDRAKLQDLNQDERREKSAELRKTESAETTKALAEVLKPEQMKRLHQIELQQEGVVAFADPEVAKKLKLSDEQKSKLKTIADDSRKEMTDLFGQGQGQEARTKMAEIRKAANEKAVGVLNDDQKKEWKEMTGAPFEVKFQGRRQRET
jgi:Spy/CpxP family protein refolding chaperone